MKLIEMKLFDMILCVLGLFTIIGLASTIMIRFTPKSLLYSPPNIFDQFLAITSVLGLISFGILQIYSLYRSIRSPSL